MTQQISVQSLRDSGVTPGTYPNATVTVDAKGRVTSAEDGTPTGTGFVHITNGVEDTAAKPVVESFNGRTGAVVPQIADYTAAQVSNAFDFANPSNTYSGLFKMDSGSHLLLADLPNVAVLGTDASGNIIASTATVGGSGVTSFNGRTGAVVPVSGDYTAAEVTNALDISNAGTQTLAGSLTVNGALKAEGGINVDNGGLTVGNGGNIVVAAGDITIAAGHFLKANNIGDVAGVQAMQISGPQTTFIGPAICDSGLTLNGGNLAVPNGSISVGGYQVAMVLIAEQILGAAAATISFNLIPNTFRHLKLVITGRSTVAGLQDVVMQLNGDTGANYDYFIMYENPASGTTATANSSTLYATASPFCACVTSASAPAGQAGSAEVIIHYYARTSFWKNSTGLSIRKDSATQGYIIPSGMTWRNTAPINSILLKINGANFDIGTCVALYGIN